MEFNSGFKGLRRTGDRNWGVHQFWRSSIRAVSWYNYESNQQDATIQVNLLFLVSSTCFGRCFRPSSGALHCIYRSGSIHPGVQDTSRQQPGWILPDTVNTAKCSWWWVKTSTHPWHRPAATWVNTTRYCKYSQVLLMMGENINTSMTPAGSNLGEYYQIL